MTVRYLEKSHRREKVKNRIPVNRSRKEDGTGKAGAICADDQSVPESLSTVKSVIKWPWESYTAEKPPHSRVLLKFKLTEDWLSQIAFGSGDNLIQLYISNDRPKIKFTEVVD